ncbi:MAG: group I intron-associated PD-(D/E)XK endonuclease [Actinomycetota bacterium]|nr:group I intron-associated PD-(D/E)XK endonuclease [Actinomycetota bacterium]
MPLTPRQQGNLGEYSAVEWLMSRGIPVAIPIGHSPDWDLVADLGDRAVKVQVKTTGCHRAGRWEVSICTRGGNQSWNGLAKYFDTNRCDYLFVLVGDGRRWFIPCEALSARSGILLGGPKYAEFEVEPGRPFEHERCRRVALQSPA